MTGIRNPNFIFCNKKDFPNLIGFNDWLNANRRMEKDFKNLNTYDLYLELVESYRNLFNYKYEYKELNDSNYDEYLVLGFGYDSKIKKAEELGANFDKSLEAIYHKWRELKDK